MDSSAPAQGRLASWWEHQLENLASTLCSATGPLGDSGGGDSPLCTSLSQCVKQDDTCLSLQARDRV